MHYLWGWFLLPSSKVFENTQGILWLKASSFLRNIIQTACFQLSKYLFKFSFGCAEACNITIIHIECINEKYIIDSNFLFKCRLPLNPINRITRFIEILLSTNLIRLCQFRVSLIIAPRKFNSVILFRIILSNFEPGDIRRILFRSICL